MLHNIEEIESLMFFFHVPKGKNDIRMVYDGIKLGLNASFYAQWFMIPTIDTLA